MKAIATEMGVFKGFEQSRILTHNIDLIRRRCYYQVGQFILWSIVNGGPGLACVSPDMLQLMHHRNITNLEDCLQRIPNDGVQNMVRQASQNKYNRWTQLTTNRVTKYLHTFSLD